MGEGAGDEVSSGTELDGTEAWWLASQACSHAAAAGGEAAPAGLACDAKSEIADDALDEWLTWFCRPPAGDSLEGA